MDVMEQWRVLAVWAVTTRLLCASLQHRVRLLPPFELYIEIQNQML
jgi:hypothetical protein